MGSAAASAAYFLYQRLGAPMKGDDDDQARGGEEEGKERPIMNSRQLYRAIKSCTHGLEAVELLRAHPSAADITAFTAAVEVCGRLKDWQQLSALTIDNGKSGMLPTEQSFTAAISAYGRCNRWEEALDMLSRAPVKLRTASSFTAAIGCCVPAGQCDRAFSLLAEMRSQQMPLTEITYVNVIAAAGKGQQCERAVGLLEEMRCTGLRPGARSYNAVIAACCKSRQWQRGASLLDEMRAHAVPPNAESFSSLISAARKAGCFDEAAVLALQARGGVKGDAPPDAAHHLFTENSLQSLRKAGTGSGGGKATRWDLAEFRRHVVAQDVLTQAGGLAEEEDECFTVALQRDCHPTRHFVKLSFVTQGVSAGFLLLEIPQGEAGFSALRGMRIADPFRSHGLSMLFLACWVQLCLEMGLTPRANRIDKPIICLLLHKFGFRPSGGIDVEISRGSGTDASKLILFSPTGKALESIFSPHELRSQNMAIALDRDATAPVGTCIRVKTAFDPPQDLNVMQMRVSEQINARGGRLRPKASAEVLRLAFLGTARLP